MLPDEWTRNDLDHVCRLAYERTVQGCTTDTQYRGAGCFKTIAKRRGGGRALEQELLTMTRISDHACQGLEINVRLLANRALTASEIEDVKRLTDYYRKVFDSLVGGLPEEKRKYARRFRDTRNAELVSGTRVIVAGVTFSNGRVALLTPGGDLEKPQSLGIYEGAGWVDWTELAPATFCCNGAHTMLATEKLHAEAHLLAIRRMLRSHGAAFEDVTSKLGHAAMVGVLAKAPLLGDVDARIRYLVDQHLAHKWRITQEQLACLSEISGLVNEAVADLAKDADVEALRATSMACVMPGQVRELVKGDQKKVAAVVIHVDHESLRAAVAEEVARDRWAQWRAGAIRWVQLETVAAASNKGTVFERVESSEPQLAM